MPACNRSAKKTKSPIKRPSAWKWIVSITVLSFCVSAFLSYVSSEVLGSVGNLVAFGVLFFFIFFGIVSDMIGVAATSCPEKEFHSMASRKVYGAKEAVWISRNAEKVSSVCNDVVGDICGIISGSTGAVILARCTPYLAPSALLPVSLCITGLIASITIGGKAFGKGIAIRHSVAILFCVGRLLHFLPIQLEIKKKNALH